MFEKRIGWPPPGSSLPDWIWKKPTAWTWAADGVGLLLCLLVMAFGIWRLIELWPW